MKIKLFFLLCFLCSLSVLGQHALAKPDSIKILEENLKVIGRDILKAKTDTLRIEANEKFRKLLYKVLQRDDALQYPFDSVTNLSKLISPDHSFRIYTWILPKVDGTDFKYFGFIQLFNKKGFLFNKHLEPGPLWVLKDKADENMDPENTKLTPEKWYGALYYKILQNKSKGKKYYTLLGWRGKNRRITSKVIDNLIIEKEKVVFGQPIFKNDKMTKNRVIFDYSAQVSMSLKFEENILVTEKIGKGKKKKTKESRFDMIVFDRLVPSSPMYEGQKEFYGPALKYDGYAFEKGKWQLKQDVDVRNEVQPKSKHKVIRNTELRIQPKKN